MTDVVHMAQQGHSPDVIITQIRNTGSTFELSTTDLDYLMACHVPDQVIIAMQATKPRPCMPGVTIQGGPMPVRVTIPPMSPPIPLPGNPGAEPKDSRELFSFWVSLFGESQSQTLAPEAKVNDNKSRPPEAPAPTYLRYRYYQR